jgi:GNAT superfamily N-acetyltransferase
MSATVVAVDEGVIFGFASTCPSRDSDLPGLAELRMIYVDPHRWGEGIGRLLMAAVRDRRRRNGAHEALPWVADRNERAKRFYEIDGWRADGLHRAENIGGVRVEVVRYRYALV